MSGWEYIVLFVVFLALSLSVRALLFRRAGGKAPAGNGENSGRKNG
jgi:hypothetical protein